MVEIGGQPWFVAADVCKCLEMDLYGGTSKWLVNLTKDEKRLAKRREHPQIFCGSYATVPATNIISESGLYKLVMRSDKPAARKFQDWVTRARLATLDVLPAIRKAEA